MKHGPIIKKYFLKNYLVIKLKTLYFITASKPN